MDRNTALPALVARLNELHAKATPGPWDSGEEDPFGDYTISPPTRTGAVAAVVNNGRPPVEVFANASLITALRNAWPEIASALTQLQAERYPHMCRDGHSEIGHADSGDDERCPLCKAIARAERAEAALAEERERWIPVTERLPEEHCGPLLVTNNLDARDAFGNMSHVWMATMLHHSDDLGYYAFDDYDNRVPCHITHWAPALPQKGEK